MPTRIVYDAEGWGVGELWLEGATGTVLWHELPSPSIRDQVTTCYLELVERLRAYFAGEDVSFEDVPVDLEYATPFHESCAQALRAVPRGEVVTYGELAALAGAPRAARAAGTFCARNRLPLFVPCHRVVASGGLGAYPTLGVDYKRRLLELELPSKRVMQLTRSAGTGREPRSSRRISDA